MAVQSFGAGFDFTELKKGLETISKDATNVFKGIVNDVGGVEKAFKGLKFPNSEIAKLGNQFDSMLASSQKSINEQKSAMALLISTGKKGTKEYQAIEDSLKADTIQAQKFSKALQDVDDDIDKIGKTSSQSSSPLSSISGLLAGLGPAAVAGAGIAAVGVGLGKVIEVGTDFNKTLTETQALTGFTDDEMNKLKDTSKDLFAKGFGEDLSGATKDLGTFKQQLGTISGVKVDDAQFEKLALGLGGLAQSAGKENTEVFNAYTVALKAFGGDSQKAFESLAYGFQQAKTPADDYLDTLLEYPKFAAKAGLSFDEFNTLLIAGAEAGLESTDKLGDSIKEMGIKLSDGSAIQSLNDLAGVSSGLEATYAKNLAGIATEVKKGTLTAAEGIAQYGELVKKGLASGDIGATFADNLTTAFGGTLGEDVTSSILANVASGLNDPSIIEKAKNGGKSAGEAFSNTLVANAQGIEGLQRVFTVFAADLSTTLIPVFNNVLAVVGDVLKSLQPLIENVFSNLTPIFGELTAILSPIIDSLVTTLVPIIERVFDVVSKLISALLPLVNAILPPLFQILGVIADAAIQVIDAFMPLVDVIIEQLLKNVPLLTNILTSLADLIATALPVALKVIIPVIEFFVKGLSDLYTIVGAVSNAFVSFGTFLITGVIDAIKSVYSFIGKIVDKLTDFLGITDKSAKSQENLKKSLEDTAAATGGSTDAQLSAVAALVSNTQSTEENTVAKNANAKATTAQVKATNSFIDGLIAENKKVVDSIKTLSDELGTLTNSSLISERTNLENKNEELLAQQVRLTEQLEGLKSLAAIDQLGGLQTDLSIPISISTDEDLFKDSLDRMAINISEFSEQAVDELTFLSDFTSNVDILTESIKALTSGDLGGFIESLDGFDLNAIFDGFKNLDADQIKDVTEELTDAGIKLGKSLQTSISGLIDGTKKVNEVLFDGLESLIPIAVATITAKLAIANPIVGLIAAAGISAGLYGLLAVARSGLGAEGGGLIDNNYSKLAGPTDTINMNVAPGEYIVKAAAVRMPGVLKILEEINSGKDFKNSLSKSFIDDQHDFHFDFALPKPQYKPIHDITYSSPEMRENKPNSDAGRVLNDMSNNLSSINKKLDKLDDIAERINNHRVEIRDRGTLTITDQRIKKETMNFNR